MAYSTATSRPSPGKCIERLLVAAIVAMAVGSADAQSRRPDAREMTCPELQQLVLDRGQVVVTTGRHTYERLVAHNGYCQFDERVRNTYVATGDTGSCRVRFCEPRWVRDPIFF